jgi:hypothetical protein
MVRNYLQGKLQCASISVADIKRTYRIWRNLMHSKKKFTLVLKGEIKEEYYIRYTCAVQNVLNR